MLPMAPKNLGAFCLIPFRKELATTSQQASKEIFI